MPSCLGCGKEMQEVSRKAIKGKAAAVGTAYKALYQCENSTCREKGKKKGFLDDGRMVIPLPDGY
jgi:hypothetical protein